MDVAVAPTAWLRAPMERLASLGLRPIAVESTGGGQADDDPPSAPDCYRILLEDAESNGASRAKLARQCLAAACIALAAAVVVEPLIRQSWDLAGGGAAEGQIAALRPRMDQVDGLRRRIASGSAGAGQLAAARVHGSAALRLLGLLTDLLPDDTFLTSLSLRHDRLTIEGRSAAATKLIATMAGDPNLKNPSFAAPVVRAENGAEVFTIQAGLGP